VSNHTFGNLLWKDRKKLRREGNGWSEKSEENKERELLGRKNMKRGLKTCGLFYRKKGGRDKIKRASLTY